MQRGEQGSRKLRQWSTRERSAETRRDPVCGVPGWSSLLCGSSRAFQAHPKASQRRESAQMLPLEGSALSSAQETCEDLSEAQVSQSLTCSPWEARLVCADSVWVVVFPPSTPLPRMSGPSGILAPPRHGEGARMTVAVTLTADPTPGAAIEFTWSIATSAGSHACLCCGLFQPQLTADVPPTRQQGRSRAGERRGLLAEHLCGALGVCAS